MSHRSSESLLFYMYFSLSKCSESRRHQVKSGVTLSEVAQLQETAFKTSLPRKNTGLTLGLVPKPSHDILSTPTALQTHQEFSPISQQSALSPAMMQYVSAPTFDKTAEQSKHKQLKRYFHEKFQFVSRVLSEDLLKKALSCTENTQERGKIEANQRKHEENEKEKVFFGLEFQKGINRINEEVEEFVNSQFEKRKKEMEKRKKLESAQRKFTQKQKKLDKKPISVRILPDFAVSVSPTRVLSPKIELDSVEKLPKLPLLSHPRSPNAIIRENEAICKALDRHFLRNVQKKERRTKSNLSFFIT